MRNWVGFTFNNYHKEGSLLAKNDRRVNAVRCVTVCRRSFAPGHHEVGYLNGNCGYDHPLLNLYLPSHSTNHFNEFWNPDKQLILSPYLTLFSIVIMFYVTHWRRFQSFSLGARMTISFVDANFICICMGGDISDLPLIEGIRYFPSSFLSMLSMCISNERFIY